ncbi:MAG: type II toxin-antitoxin system VapC family toxin [Cytophagaceae bacterium]|nr:type II toxin-antitoxin system VapC family toxin [Cytophagaceae bacterium]MDW8457410.1 type II toxin-antitoxin system VapC family toxin [Cytophagaceae bacterium]
MQTAVLDTNILIHYFKNSRIAHAVQDFLKTNEFTTIISVITKAELLAISKRNNWGERKINVLNDLLSSFVCIDIEYNNSVLLDAYASIDAFSQGKITAPNGQMLNTSPRNMGKNDLWIAATAHALDAVLITTDNDFDHLHNIFFKVKKF